MPADANLARKYRVAIIGAGPAGLSAAARAAQLDQKLGAAGGHILLEGFNAHAKTIQRYQKGKHVMAEPGFLDLRSDLRFDAGSREKILQDWAEDYAKSGVNLRLGAAVTAVKGQRGDFSVTIVGGEVVRADNVVLAIGLEGNPRRLGAPGDHLEGIQYQLDDPKEFVGETILVVGAGDAAIENALALQAQNKVMIVVRGGEFARAKEGNLNAVLAAINDPAGNFGCFYRTKIKSIQENAGQNAHLRVVLDTPTGDKPIDCHRIIARLGADPPRRFVESLGIQFPNDQPDAVPALDKHYQSNVPGIFVIGSLAGYPLIKQAMNQGYDVAEYLYGNAEIKPVDQQLIEWQFAGIAFSKNPDEILEKFKSRVPMFDQLNALAFRELIIESELSVAYREGPDLEDEIAKVERLRVLQRQQGRTPRATRIIREGDAIYEAGDYGTSFYTIVQGSVTLQTPGSPALTAQLKAGDFFGEMSLLSGRPRAERALAGAACVLVETPRRTMIKLMSSNESLRRGIDWIFVTRQLQRHFAPAAPVRMLREIASRVAIRRVKAGEMVFAQGERGQCLYLVRSGGLTLYRRDLDAKISETRLSVGELAGANAALIGRGDRQETARAAVRTELLEVKREVFLGALQLTNSRSEDLQRAAQKLQAGSAHPLRSYAPGDTVYTQGEAGESVFVVLRGSLKLLQRLDDGVAVAQVAAGELAGEMALMGDQERRETARASFASELIELNREEFMELIKLSGSPVEELQCDASTRLTNNARTQAQPGAPPMMKFLMDQGLGEATDVLVIDESLCVGCDNCERACAETHAGVSRLDRKAGVSYANVHVPIACRHCDQPHCMKDCPPNAIRRSATGEVYINDSCIGCGNCQTNCPYDVIRMVYEAPSKPGLLSWLLFGAGPGMGEQINYSPTEHGKSKGKKAVKCDACIGLKNGPACVAACPTGAAIRISPKQYVDLLEPPE